MKNRILTIALLTTMYSYATISDNRFIPWYQQTRIRDYDKFAFDSSLFFITGDSAYGNEAIKKCGIPEVYGKFDQLKLGIAAQAVGKQDPLNPLWQTRDKIEWNVHGKIQGQGASFNYLQDLNDYISWGFNINVLHLTSHQKFILPKDVSNELLLTPSLQEHIDNQRRELLRNIGISDIHWSDAGFSDMTLFVKLAKHQMYKYKCRYVSLGTTFGVVIPTSKQRDITYASSLPFGGENLTGFLWSADLQAELKEDLWAGVSFEILKRFEKTQIRRLPIKGEPEIFAPLSGEVKVDPGITFAFTPFIRLNNLREGLHFQGQYIYQKHDHDAWVDERLDQSISSDFTNVVKKSEWKTEYVLFKISYDASESSLVPTVHFAWDIPVKFLKPEESAKTQKVSLGFEFNF